MGIVLPDNIEADVVKVNGLCYQFVGVVNQQADIPAAEGTFETCEECESETSNSSASSISSESLSSFSSQMSSAGISSSASPEECGAPAQGPPLLITLSWISSDVTKEWNGCTWENGETKKVWPSEFKWKAHDDPANNPNRNIFGGYQSWACLLYTSPSPRD